MKRKLNKTLKKQWIKALESDEYCQTSEALIDCSGYCCLGVLLDVAGCPTGSDEEFIHPDHKRSIDAEGGYTFTNDLGERDYGNIFEDMGLPFQERIKLMSRNDGSKSPRHNKTGRRWSFKQIANSLKKSLK